MTPDRKDALGTALQRALPQNAAEEDDLTWFHNADAMRDWNKFGSVTALADQLEAGSIVDPDVLIVAAAALRKLSEKTERAALGRRALFLRDMKMHVEAGYYFRRPKDRKASEMVEETAERNGFSDIRGAWKAIQKYIKHIGDNTSKY